MTHPLLSSPGNTAAQLQPVEHASGNKNGKSGSNADAQVNGNDFKKMVRELSSDGQPKPAAKAEQNGLLQAKQVTTPVETDEDDELPPEDEEGLSEADELDATAELPEDDDGEDSLPEAQVAQGHAEEGDLPAQDRPAIDNGRRDVDLAVNLQPQPSAQQDDADAEIRPAERQSAQQPAQPPARAEDALRASLQRMTSVTTPTEADGQPAAPPDPKAAAQVGEASKVTATASSTVSPPVDPVNQTDAAIKPTVKQHSQISLTDGQLRAIQNATSGAPSPNQTIESPQAQTVAQIPGVSGDERLPPANDARLGIVNGDLQTLLREQRAGESATVSAMPNLGQAATGTSPDAVLVSEDDDRSEGKFLGAMQDSNLLRRVAALAGAQVNQPNFETALSVSRQLSQGVFGAVSVWVGAASSQPPGSGSTGSSGDFMGGRGPASDLNTRAVGQPPGALRTIRLQLQPASLGTVTAQLTMKNDELHVKFVVERAETSELIQSQRNLLLAQLVEAGVEVNSANVEVETARTSGARASASHPGLAGGSNEFAGGAFGNADGQSRSASGERDGLAEQAAVDDDGSGNETTGQTTQRPSVVYL